MYLLRVWKRTTGRTIGTKKRVSRKLCKNCEISFQFDCTSFTAHRNTCQLWLTRVSAIWELKKVCKATNFAIKRFLRWWRWRRLAFGLFVCSSWYTHYYFGYYSWTASWSFGTMSKLFGNFIQLTFWDLVCIGLIRGSTYMGTFVRSHQKVLWLFRYSFTICEQMYPWEVL